MRHKHWPTSKHFARQGNDRLFLVHFFPNQLLFVCLFHFALLLFTIQVLAFTQFLPLRVSYVLVSLLICLIRCFIYLIQHLVGESANLQSAILLDTNPSVLLKSVFKKVHLFVDTTLSSEDQGPNSGGPSSPSVKVNYLYTYIKLLFIKGL